MTQYINVYIILELLCIMPCMYTIYILKSISSPDIKKFILVNTIDNQYTVTMFCFASHKHRMLLLHYTAMACDRPAIEEVRGERFHWVFNKKRAGKCCDAPLSLLCSVCKNTHCREKSQVRRKRIQMHQTLQTADKIYILATL